MFGTRFFFFVFPELAVSLLPPFLDSSLRDQVNKFFQPSGSSPQFPFIIRFFLFFFFFFSFFFFSRDPWEFPFFSFSTSPLGFLFGFSGNAGICAF